MDISNNKIELRGSKLFKHLESLTKIDLSENKLAETSPFKVRAYYIHLHRHT